MKQERKMQNMKFFFSTISYQFEIIFLLSEKSTICRFNRCIFKNSHRERILLYYQLTNIKYKAIQNDVFFSYITCRKRPRI